MGFVAGDRVVIVLHPHWIENELPRGGQVGTVVTASALQIAVRFDGGRERRYDPGCVVHSKDVASDNNANTSVKVGDHVVLKQSVSIEEGKSARVFVAGISGVVMGTSKTPHHFKIRLMDKENMISYERLAKIGSNMFTVVNVKENETDERFPKFSDEHISDSPDDEYAAPVQPVKEKRRRSVSNDNYSRRSLNTATTTKKSPKDSKKVSKRSSSRNISGVKPNAMITKPAKPVLQQSNNKKHENQQRNKKTQSIQIFQNTKRKFVSGDRVVVHHKQPGVRSKGTVIVAPVHPNTWYKVIVDGNEKPTTFRGSSLSPLIADDTNTEVTSIGTNNGFQEKVEKHEKQKYRKRPRAEMTSDLLSNKDGQDDNSTQSKYIPSRPKRQRSKPVEFIASPYSQKKIAPWLVDCIGIISKQPMHPNTWFAIRFPMSSNEDTFVDIKLQKNAIRIAENGEQGKSLPFDNIKKYATSGVSGVTIVFKEAEELRKAKLLKDELKNRKDTGISSKVGDDQSAIKDEVVDTSKFPLLSTVSPEEWLHSCVMITAGRHRGITASVSGAGNGWVQLIPHDKSVTGVVAKRAQDLVVIPLHLASDSGKLTDNTESASQKNMEAQSVLSSNNLSNIDNTADSTTPMNGDANNSNDNNFSIVDMNTKTNDNTTTKYNNRDTKRKGTKHARRVSAGSLLINKTVVLTDGRHGSVSGSGHGFFTIKIIDPRNGNIESVLKRKEEFRVLEENTKSNTQNINSLSYSSGSTNKQDAIKMTKSEGKQKRSRKHSESEKRKPARRQRTSSYSRNERTDVVNSVNNINTMSFCGKNIASHLRRSTERPVESSSKTSRARRSYRRGILNAKREIAKQYVAKWQRKIKMPNGQNRPNFQLFLDDLELDQEGPETEIRRHAAENHDDAIDLIKIRKCIHCNAEMGSDWKFCWNLKCTNRPDIYVCLDDEKKQPELYKNMHPDLFLQLEAKARIRWIGDNRGLCNISSGSTDLSNLACRWNVWNRQSRDVIDHPEIKSGIKLMKFSQTTVSHSMKRSLRNQAQLALQMSCEQQYLRMRMKQRALEEQYYREQIQLQNERLQRIQKNNEQRQNINNEQRQNIIGLQSIPLQVTQATNNGSNSSHVETNGQDSNTIKEGAAQQNINAEKTICTTDSKNTIDVPGNVIDNNSRSNKIKNDSSINMTTVTEEQMSNPNDSSTDINTVIEEQNSEKQKNTDSLHSIDSSNNLNIDNKSIKISMESANTSKIIDTSNNIVDPGCHKEDVLLHPKKKMKFSNTEMNSHDSNGVKATGN